jgi:G3E family GTPase
MLHDFDTGDLLSSRRDDVTPEDERTVSDLMVDQIEFADVIILNKLDMVSQSLSLPLIIINKLPGRRIHKATTAGLDKEAQPSGQGHRVELWKG